MYNHPPLHIRHDERSKWDIDEAGVSLTRENSTHAVRKRPKYATMPFIANVFAVKLFSAPIGVGWFSHETIHFERA